MSLKQNKEIEAHLAGLGKSLDRPIVLLGMMGTGKSHLGMELSKLLHLPFFDSDRLIEEKAGCAVAEIFERFGESKFREAERNTVMTLLDEGTCVIATGGGVVTNDEVLQHIKNKAVSVWLKTDVPSIMARLQGKTDRPLLQKGNPEDVLGRLMEERAPLYGQADIAVDTVQGSVEDTLKSLIKALYAQVNADNF